MNLAKKFIKLDKVLFPYLHKSKNRINFSFSPILLAIAENTNNYGTTGSWEETKQTFLGWTSEKLAEFFTDVIGKAFILVWANVFPVIRWLCLLVAMAGILLMAVKHSKGRDYTFGSIAVYLVCKAIDFMIRG